MKISVGLMEIQMVDVTVGLMETQMVYKTAARLVHLSGDLKAGKWVG